MRLIYCLLIGSLALASNALAGVDQTVSDLIPGLASANVHDRYGPQMELQRLALDASRPGAEAQRLALAKVLAAKAADPAVPQPARVWLVRQLEYIGAAEAVPALNTLLKDPDAELRECTRRALEKNAAPAAVETLRDALKAGGDTRWTIGLVQSLGERHDAQSVDLISRQIDKAEVAFAACSALAKIGTAPAVDALWTAFDKNVPPAADALIAAADHLALTRQQQRAAAIYSRLYKSGPSTGIRSASLIGLAATEPGPTKPLVKEALSANDSRLQVAAITAARGIYGPGSSAALAPLLPGLNDFGKVLVLRILDDSAEPQVIAAAGTGSEPVRVAALERLGQIGTAKGVPTLVQTASDRSSPVQSAAVAALARISGSGADAAIAEMAARGESATRVTAIRALARRADRSAIPALFKYTAEPGQGIAAAAWAALADLGTDTELEHVARLALDTSAPDAETALHSIATRVQDKTVAADKLVSLLRGATPKQSAVVFETLAVLGGDSALKSVSAAVSSNDEAVKQAALRALANWPDFEAVKPLLAVAADQNSSQVYHVLALHGVARLVKSSEGAPAAARLQAALTAMKCASREEDKKLFLSVLASVPDPKAAEPIRACLTDPNLKTEAGLAGINLARTLYRSDRAAARSLAQAVKDAQISDDITRRAEALLSGRRR